MWLLKSVFSRIITSGALTLIGPDGERFTVRGRESGPEIGLRFKDKAIARALALHPRLKLGEGYMDGRITVEGGDIYDFLDFAGRNTEVIDSSIVLDAVNRLRRLARRLQQHNTLRLARRRVAHHYDLSSRLYDLFLDADRQYSCAYFRTPTDTLEQAQENKKRHLTAKLLLQPNCSVLDIGSGWGGLGLHLARCGAERVVGLTLSEEQLRVANERARAAGFGDRVTFKLQDYRQERARYDRIVSVGMFEHVGVGYYAAFFAKLRELLAEDGVAVVHSIGRHDGPGVMNAFINKYIFPGAYAPSLSEVLPAIERSGLIVNDVEILRLHYAETLREWRRRFLLARAEVLQVYDERFLRMWEFYLASCEIAFRSWGFMVWQVQLTRRLDVVPLTRDYIYAPAAERQRADAVAA
jgi:cyclopropane-fatty-acyl-phospholipid synthase